MTSMDSDFTVRPKLGEEVTRHLREQILTGAFPEGERLAIDKIAQRLGVSSMPVREAMTALASEGIVEMIPRRGFRVAPLLTEDIQDVFMVHAFVAGALAKRACANFTDDDIAQLREIQGEIEQVARKRLSEERRLSEIEQLNFTFHRTINARASGSRRLRWFLRASQRFVPGQYFFTTPGWVESSLTDHETIIKALADRDCEAAGSAMRTHILYGGALVVEHMADVPAPDEPA